MSEKSNLEAFKELREKLLTEYKTKELELATMRKELEEIGIIVVGGKGSAAASRSSSAGRRTGKRGKRVQLDEAAVIKFFGNKELGYKEVAERFGKSEQTTKIWLDKSSKFSRRNEDSKNKKSKVLYKVK